MFLLKHFLTTKARIAALVILLILFSLPAICLASQFRSDDTIFIGPHDKIEGNFYAASPHLTVAGKIKGDLIFVGQDIEISGPVDGDIIGIGQNIEISGPVNGSVRLLASDQVKIASSVARNLMVFTADKLTIASSSQIGWDVLAAGGKIFMRGKIKNNFYARGQKIVISGQVGQKANLQLHSASSKPHLIIASSALIGSDFKYSDWLKAQIDKKAQIKGQVIYNQPKQPSRPFFSFAWALKETYIIFSVFVIGLVLVSLWRQPVIKLTDLMLEKVSPSLWYGVLLMFVSPFVFVLMAFTLIGLPLAVILFGVWLLAMFLAKVVTAILLGRSLIEKFWPSKDYSLVWAMIVGVLVLWPLFSLPFLGFVFTLLASWWGLGGFYLYFKKV